MALTEEEKKQHQLEAQRRYRAKKVLVTLRRKETQYTNIYIKEKP